MRRDDALAILSAHRDKLTKLGVKSIAIFGSVARDEARPESDVDVLIEVDRSKPFGLLALIRVNHYLEDIFAAKVDVGEFDTLRPRMREQVMKEMIHAA